MNEYERSAKMLFALIRRCLDEAGEHAAGSAPEEAMHALMNANVKWFTDIEET